MGKEDYWDVFFLYEPNGILPSTKGQPTVHQAKWVLLVGGTLGHSLNIQNQPIIHQIIAN